MAKNKAALSTNNYILLAILITIVVVLVSALIGAKLVDQAKLNSKVISKKSQANKQLKENLDILGNLKQQYDNLGSKKQLISAAMPSMPDFPAIVSAMEVVAGTSGVKLKSVTPSIDKTDLASTPAGNGPQEFLYSVTIEGNYDNVLKFLGNVELTARPSKVISMTQSGSGNLQMVEINLVTYYQAPADLTPKTEEVK